jgi:hypothetical protein
VTAVTGAQIVTAAAWGALTPFVVFVAMLRLPCNTVRSVTVTRRRPQPSQTVPTVVFATRTHRAPARPFTPAQAHREWREHMDCAASDCARKAAAMSVLVAAGQISVARQRRWRVERGSNRWSRDGS